MIRLITVIGLSIGLVYAYNYTKGYLDTQDKTYQARVEKRTVYCKQRMPSYASSAMLTRCIGLYPRHSRRF